MTKFEEEFDENVEIFNVIGNHNSMCCEVDQVKEVFKDWQPQQALPVVPECVAKFVSGDENELSKADRIAYLLKSVEGDNYYLEEYLTNAEIISQEQGEHLYAWATNQNHETILKLWNGYTVEKPQLFYLKEKNFGYYIANEEMPGIDSPTCMYIENAEKFTQQEIDSMNTGSYERIEVEKLKISPGIKRRITAETPNEPRSTEHVLPVAILAIKRNIDEDVVIDDVYIRLKNSRNETLVYEYIKGTGI